VAAAQGRLLVHEIVTRKPTSLCERAILGVANRERPFRIFAVLFGVGRRMEAPCEHVQKRPAAHLLKKAAKREAGVVKMGRDDNERPLAKRGDMLAR